VQRLPSDLLPKSLRRFDAVAIRFLRYKFFAPNKNRNMKLKWNIQKRNKMKRDPRYTMLSHENVRMSWDFLKRSSLVIHWGGAVGTAQWAHLKPPLPTWIKYQQDFYHTNQARPNTSSYKSSMPEYFIIQIKHTSSYKSSMPEYFMCNYNTECPLLT